MMDFNSLTEEQKRAFAKAYEEEKKQKEERNITKKGKKRRSL